jgi:hypothetical protein
MVVEFSAARVQSTKIVSIDGLVQNVVFTHGEFRMYGSYSAST